MTRLDEYRQDLRSKLPHGSFLRLDRGEALFVSDAPRLGIEIDPESLSGYQVKIEDKLMYITPSFIEAPEKLREMLIHCLKSEGIQKERLLRMNLAKALREKDQVCTDFLQAILDEEERKNEDPVAGTCLL